MRTNPLSKRDRVPRLDEHGARARKLAHQSLPAAQPTDDPPRRHALEYVFRVPGDQVSIIYDVAFAFLELLRSVSLLRATLRRGRKWEGNGEGEGEGEGEGDDLHLS